MNCGIMGLGIYLPERYMTAQELAKETGIPEAVIRGKFGINKKYLPGPNDTPSYMGLQAAQQALTEAGVAAEELDLVIWCGSQHKDYLSWLAGVKVAHELGATNAGSFDLSAMCSSTIVAMEVAKSLLLTNSKYTTILLVSGYRLSDFVDIHRADTSFMYDMAAGGAAMVIRKNYNQNIIRGIATKVDGSFSEECIIKYGGAKNWPLQPQQLSELHFIVTDQEQFKVGLKQKTMVNFQAVIKEALAESNLSEADIDYLAILHFKKSAHEAVLKELGLSEQQSTYLSDYGHIGPNDQILSLKLGLESGKLTDGANVVMVSSGLGFVWAAAVIEWGPK